MVGAARRAIFLNNISRILIGAVIAAIAALLIVFLLYPYFNAWLSGGTTWTAADFNNPAPAEDIYYLNTTSNFGGDLGYSYETTYLFIPVSRVHYGAVFIGDNTLLITKSGSPLEEFNTDYPITGTLKDFSSDERNEVLLDFRNQIPSEVADVIYPKLLDMTDSENKGLWIGGAVLAVGAALFGVYWVLRGIAFSLNPNGHPLWKNLARFNLPPEDVLRGIEADRDSGTEKHGKLELTRRWLTFRNGGAFQVMRMQDVVWLHGYLVNGRYGTTYFVKVYDRHGVEIQAPVKKDDMEPTLQAIFRRAPWALAGTTKEAEQLWKKNRADFVRQIDERKKSLERGESSGS